MKTKLGVSTGVLAALAFFAAIFGGYIPVIIVVGYILLFEEDEWLKKTAVKAIVLAILFSLIITLIGLIPDILNWLSTILSWFKLTIKYSIVNTIVSFITSTLALIRTCLFLILGFIAITKEEIKVPIVDKFVEKYF